MLSLLAFIWTRRGFRCYVQVITEVFVFCPVSQPGGEERVTAPSPEQSCEHTRSCYCCACTDLIPSRVSANFCCFCTQNIQCTQCTALRAGTTKKALLPLPISASTVAILFYGHWGQTSLFPLFCSFPITPGCIMCTGVEMSSCWLWG